MPLPIPIYFKLSKMDTSCLESCDLHTFKETNMMALMET